MQALYDSNPATFRVTFVDPGREVEVTAAKIICTEGFFVFSSDETTTALVAAHRVSHIINMNANPKSATLA